MFIKYQIVLKQCSIKQTSSSSGLRPDGLVVGTPSWRALYIPFLVGIPSWRALSSGLCPDEVPLLVGIPSWRPCRRDSVLTTRLLHRRDSVLTRFLSVVFDYYYYSFLCFKYFLFYIYIYIYIYIYMFLFFYNFSFFILF